MPITAYLIFAGVVGLSTWARWLRLSTAAWATVTFVLLAVVLSGAR